MRDDEFNHYTGFQANLEIRQKSGNQILSQIVRENVREFSKSKVRENGEKSGKNCLWL